MKRGMMLWTVGGLAMAAALASCGAPEGPTPSEVNAASVALLEASTKAAAGEPVDRAALGAMPGIDAALVEAAEGVKRSVARQLRDPTDPLWGDIWTTDFVVICGTVNGRNAYGAYAGDEVFYAPDGISARLPGSPGYKAEDLQMCFGGGHRVIIPRTSPPAAT